jgi:hypothetical protein
MIVCRADESGQWLTLSYSGHVGVEELRRCRREIEDLLGRLKPGFFLLGDLSNLESMDPDCASEIGAIMDLGRTAGVSTVVRVIPDPEKDIGFGLMSHFHLPAPIRTKTYESLAEALSSLLAERGRSLQSA